METLNITSEQPMRPHILKNERLLNIILHNAKSRNWTPDVEREYETAVRDLVEENYFHLCKNIEGGKIVGPIKERGPYILHLSIKDNRLHFDIRRMQMEDGHAREIKREELTVPMTPFRSIIKDYFLICESYFALLKGHQMHKMESVDMARRGIHNEGSELLQELMRPQVDVDFDTARRLFTLICVLHFR